MHPDLASALAVQHHHDMLGQASQAARARQASQAARAGQGRRPPRAAPRAHLHLPRALFPRYRVTWSRTTLAPAAGGRRGRSWLIVISATRGL